MSLICVIDLETSGLDPRECGVLEMGAVMLSPDLLPLGEWSVAVRLCAWHRWEDGAARVHGVSKEEAMSEARCSEPVAMGEFFRFVDSHSRGERVVLAGMNLASFDLQFLKAIVERVSPALMKMLLGFGIKQLISHRTIDIHAVAAAHVLAQGGDISRLYTDGIYQMLGMEAEPKPHAALTGAQMEAEALRRLVALMGKGAAV